MDYFPHDTDAASDEKVESLRILYGNDGYAFYFILLERIYRTADFELDISDAETRQILARKVEVTPQKFDDMLASALKRSCFDREAYTERGVLTSSGIKKRADTVVSKRQKMASAYSNRVSSAETGAETPQRKVKESKGNTTSVVGATTDQAPALKAEKAKREQAMAAHTDPDYLQNVDESPLVKPDAFAAILRATGYPNLDAERYRLQIAAKSEGVRRTSSQWRSRIIEFVNNDYTAGKLLTHPVLTPNEVPGNWDTTRQGAYTAPMGQGIPHPSSYLKPDFTPR